MKRGLITWDKSELPPSAFEARLQVVRQRLDRDKLPALVVYTDVWRSNQGRYLSNFMPYWNRALLVIPRDTAPVLLCGLSPRVYPWIRSVSILEEIRPSTNIAQQLAQLRTEKGWSEVGVLDADRFPTDLAVPESLNVPWEEIHPEPDQAEVAMYRRAAKMAREILAQELSRVEGIVGRLELRYRRAGAEDLVISQTGNSISVTVEYRGHWVKIARPIGNKGNPSSLSRIELLSGPYPYECCQRKSLRPGAIFAVTEGDTGDSYRLGADDQELL